MEIFCIKNLRDVRITNIILPYVYLTLFVFLNIEHDQ